MESDHIEEIDMEVLSSAWPEDLNDEGKQFNLEKPGADEDMFEGLKLYEEPTSVDLNHLLELTTDTEKGSSQLANLVKSWEYKHANDDNNLRYRFCFNHFPTLGEEEIIGKTDVEVFTGGGVKESQDFKREVLERGVAAKREITFETELFGSKTFLIYVEHVFSKAGEPIGVNYMRMDVTDQRKGNS